MFPIGLKKFLWLKKLIVLCHGHIISDSNSEENIERFDEKELLKTNQKVFRVEKIIKRKWEKLYVNWKGCKNSFNSWIDEKNIE